MHSPGYRGKGLEVSQSYAKSSYLDFNAVARVDMDAVRAVQESQGVAGHAP